MNRHWFFIANQCSVVGLGARMMYIIRRVLRVTMRHIPTKYVS